GGTGRERQAIARDPGGGERAETQHDRHHRRARGDERAANVAHRAVPAGRTGLRVRVHAAAPCPPSTLADACAALVVSPTVRRTPTSYAVTTQLPNWFSKVSAVLRRIVSCPTGVVAFTVIVNVVATSVIFPLGSPRPSMRTRDAVVRTAPRATPAF